MDTKDIYYFAMTPRIDSDKNLLSFCGWSCWG